MYVVLMTCKFLSIVWLKNIQLFRFYWSFKITSYNKGKHTYSKSKRADFKEFTFSLLPTFQTNIYSNNVNISEAFMNKDFIVIFLWSLNSSFRNVFSQIKLIKQFVHAKSNHKEVIAIIFHWSLDYAFLYFNNSQISEAF